MKNDPRTAQRLTADRAFVVQFRAGSAAAGRVEHVTSNEVAHFDSLEELLAVLARMLRTCRPGIRR